MGILQFRFYVVEGTSRSRIQGGVFASSEKEAIRAIERAFHLSQDSRVISLSEKLIGESSAENETKGR